ncbi:MAG: ArnT family glycosyltransferase [Gammaproteobacteria bacterium]
MTVVHGGDDGTTWYDAARMRALKKLDPLHWLLIVLGVIYAFALFNHGPVPSMEPRFAEAVREMLARGEWLIPIKNGVPYIEYPPLYFWLGILGALAGLPLTAAIRLPGYIGFLLWVLWLARLQKDLFPQWPRWLLPLTAAALPAILYNFFTAQSDSLLILGTLIALTGFVRLRTDPKRRGFPWELWLGVLLATAAKGPVGLAITLPVMAIEVTLAAFLNVQPATSEGPSIGAHISWIAKEAWRMAPLRGIALALLGIVPWYIAAGFTAGWEFVRAVLVYQNFTRFLTGFDHLQPWWMYFQSIWGDLVPLSLLLPFGVYFGFRYIREFRWRVLLVWTLFTLLFFTISASKQSKYILPAAPAMAVLALAAIEPLFRSDNLHRLVRRILVGIAVAVLIVFAGGVFVWLPLHQNRIGGFAGYEQIKATMAKTPGTIVSFQWPRPMTLYVLGAPMPYVRSSRQLYAEIHTGKIKPGDYILVNTKYLPDGGQPDDMKLLPPLQAPYFQEVLHVRAEDLMVLYRVLPAATTMPIPVTPTPVPWHWWEQFDTD